MLLTARNIFMTSISLLSKSTVLSLESNVHNGYKTRKVAQHSSNISSTRKNTDVQIQGSAVGELKNALKGVPSFVINMKTRVSACERAGLTIPPSGSKKQFAVLQLWGRICPSSGATLQGYSR